METVMSNEAVAVLSPESAYESFPTNSPWGKKPKR
jgi:hypothetical protein